MAKAKRKRRSKLDKDKEVIIALYNDGIGTPELGRQYNTTSKNIWDFLKRHGVHIRDRSVDKGNFPRYEGEKNPAWKGDDAGINAMHMWVKHWKGKALSCENCGREDSFYDWHNIDHTYKRVLNDYISLCRKCHYQFNKELRERGGSY